MKLKELKEAIERVYAHNHNHADDIEVCIPNQKGAIGGIKVTCVKYAGRGID